MIGIEIFLFLFLLLACPCLLGRPLSSFFVILIGPAVKIGSTLTSLKIIIDITQHRDSVTHFASSRLVLSNEQVTFIHVFQNLLVVCQRVDTRPIVNVMPNKRAKNETHKAIHALGHATGLGRDFLFGYLIGIIHHTGTEVDGAFVTHIHATEIGLDI